MNNSQLYGKWYQWLTQHIPDSCQSRLKNMVLLMFGLYLSGSIHLNKIAYKLPIRAKKLSLVRRLSRFLDNGAVDVETWYAAWAEWIMRSASSGGSLRLILDTTKVTASQRLLCVAVGYQRRAVPLIWDWVGHHKGHCTVHQQMRLLEQLHAMIADGMKVSIVGDGEFGNVLMLELLDHWGWAYALRQAKDTKISGKGIHGVQRLDDLAIHPGQTRILHDFQLTLANYPTNLVIIWRRTEDEPIYLATNQASVKSTWKLYKRRMWIEEMFGDMKGNGFDLEKSRLWHAERLNRLMLAVSLVYIWLIAVGEYVWHNDLADEVDRNDRRDLSIFRLGWDFIERRLALNDPFPDCFRPNFCLVSGW